MKITPCCFGKQVDPTFLEIFFALAVNAVWAICDVMNMHRVRHDNMKIVVKWIESVRSHFVAAEAPKSNFAPAKFWVSRRSGEH